MNIVTTDTHPTDPQFVLVPREPTEEMLAAIDKANTIWSGSLLTWQEVASRVYKSTLAAAPAPPAQGDGLSLVRRFADELRKWWSFNEGQRHTHTWHSREDFIEKKLPELLAGEYAELTTIRAQADALVEALEPFAAYPPTNPISDRAISDNLQISNGSPFARPQLTMGQCRKARAALASYRGK